MYNVSLVPRPHPLFNVPVFQRVTLKNWEWPGDEASIMLCNFRHHRRYFIEANCICQAGSGSFGECYDLDEFNRIKQLRLSESCTSGLQQDHASRSLNPAMVMISHA